MRHGSKLLVHQLTYAGSQDAHSLRDREEAPFVPEPVESWIDFDRDQIERAIVGGFGEPLEPEIEVAERELNPCEFKRRHVSLLRIRLEFLQHFERLLPSAGERESPPEAAMH